MTPETLVAWLEAVGLPLLVLLTILNRVGAPTWISILLITAGSLARDDRFDPLAVISCAVVGLTIGDICGYIIGQRSLTWLGRFVAQRTRYQRAYRALERHRDPAIFLSRFLILFLTVPVNLLAATLRVPLPRFLLLATPGNCIFVLIYFGLGYWFGGNWQRVWQLSQEQSPVVYVTLLIMGAIAAYGMWRWQRAK